MSHVPHSYTEALKLADELESGSRDDDEGRVQFTIREDMLVVAALRAYVPPSGPSGRVTPENYRSFGLIRAACPTCLVDFYLAESRLDATRCQ